VQFRDGAVWVAHAERRDDWKISDWKKDRRFDEIENIVLDEYSRFRHYYMSQEDEIGK
jgi:hypothetical protein